VGSKNRRKSKQKQVGHKISHSDGRNKMDDQKKSQESTSGAAAGIKQQVSEAAADASQKVSEFGRKATEKIDESRFAAAGALDKAAGQLSETAPSVAEKVKGAAEYVRQTELTAMAEDVKDIVKRYPGRSLVAAAVAGFLLAHLGSRD
jgi:ElaB/YqjD/DUF883 family membrane-anchored ribosome-binding protein